MRKIIGYICMVMVSGSLVSPIMADGHPPPPPEGMMPEDGMMHHPDGMAPKDGMMHGPDGMMPKDGMMHGPDGIMDDKLDIAVAEEFFGGDIEAAAGMFQQLDKFGVRPEDCGYFPPGPPM